MGRDERRVECMGYGIKDVYIICIYIEMYLSRRLHTSRHIPYPIYSTKYIYIYFTPYTQHVYIGIYTLNMSIYKYIYIYIYLHSSHTYIYRGVHVLYIYIYRGMCASLRDYWSTVSYTEVSDNIQGQRHLKFI